MGALVIAQSPEIESNLIFLIALANTQTTHVKGAVSHADNRIAP
jgi:hypothetical protein